MITYWLFCRFPVTTEMGTGEIGVRLRLPEWQCDQCILQWTYTAGQILSKSFVITGWNMLLLLSVAFIGVLPLWHCRMNDKGSPWNVGMLHHTIILHLFLSYNWPIWLPGGLTWLQLYHKELLNESVKVGGNIIQDTHKNIPNTEEADKK